MYKPEGFLLNTPENMKAISSFEGLAKALETSQILEGRAVLCDNEHNLTVELPCGRFTIPRQMAQMAGNSSDIGILIKVGKPVCFKVRSLSGADAELSRTAAQEECSKYYFENCPKGRIVDARIVNLESFGAFADIGCGVTALLPINCISVSRIGHPRDRFYTGQNIKAAIKDIDTENMRITITHRELLGTWEQNAALFRVGQTCAGIVRGVTDYGIFVELAPNLSGLAEYRDGIRAGMFTSVYIKSIIPEKMKMKLAIIDAFEGEPRQTDYDYFIRSGDLAAWRYSPEVSGKIVESVF